MTKPQILIILGPTASGKSKLAVQLAKKWNGEVVSADSRQLYRGLTIGTGKITKSEMENIPHHLLDIISPRQLFTAADFQKIARRTITGILKRGRLPIIAGGTAFYIDSLIYNWELPSIPPNPKRRQELARLSPAELLQILKLLNPDYASSIDSKNPRRLIRAIEIASAGHFPRPLNNDSPYNYLKLGLSPSPTTLKKNIALRTNKMLRRGLLSEVKKLHQKLSWQRLENFGLIYREVTAFLQKKISRSEMIELINRRSYQYARRQLTWWKRDPRIHWLKQPTEADHLISSWLKNKNSRV